MNAPEFTTDMGINFEEGAMNTPSLGSVVMGCAAIGVTTAAAVEIGRKGGNAIYDKTAGLFKDKGGN